MSREWIQPLPASSSRCSCSSVLMVSVLEISCRDKEPETLTWENSVRRRPADHDRSKIQPSDHSGAEQCRGSASCQDGPQLAPAGPQTEDMEHANCGVRSHLETHNNTALNGLSFFLLSVVGLEVEPLIHSWNFTQQFDDFRTTNADGQCPGLLSHQAFSPGMYKLRFETGSYWEALGQTSFHPYVEVSFTKLHQSAWEHWQNTVYQVKNLEHQNKSWSLHLKSFKKRFEWI